MTMAAHVHLISEDNFFFGLTENISELGLFVSTWAELQVGTSVRITIVLLGEKIELDAIVRWCRLASEHHSPGVGLGLEPPSADDRARIRDFMQLREPSFYDL